MLASFHSYYLASGLRASPWLPSGFGEREERVRHVRRAAGRILHPEVAQALRAQDRALPASPSRLRNLDRLATPGTACVVTGQQMGLYLGPLYTFYKAATAIVLARALEAEAGVPCVPVFWLQTEDHDFAEIDHCWVPSSAGEPIRLSLDEDGGASGAGGDAGGGEDGGRISVEHRELPRAILAANRRLSETLSELPHATDFLARLDAHHQPGMPLGRAFAGLLAELFADDGLVILNPRDPAIGRAAAPILRTALRRAADIDERLVARGEALRAAGLAEQVHVRPGHSLAFFHVGDARGPRHRLERQEGGFMAPGLERVYPSDELERLLEDEPLRFSTSALLRPIVQDSLLPTAAYVGGPAEVSYFAQLAPVYELCGVPMPMVAPRARFRILDGAMRSLVRKLGLEPADLEQPRERLVQKLAAPGEGGRPAPDQVRAGLLDGFSQHLAALEADVPSLDPGLARATRRTRLSVERAVDRLVGRYGRALFQRDQAHGERLARALRWLYPLEKPQERVYSVPYFHCRFGRAFHDRVLGAIDPFNPAVVDLDL